MSKRCDICGKEPAFGNNVSHAHNVTARRWNPNIQKVRVIVDGSHKRLNVCTRCIKSERIEKV
ncbi:MAG: 50S ribosomal protein L28 [Nitrospinae bacterium]|nr:50S ribosomal protein L28 [Nitrospinota bacterium]MBI3813332.1 50S ribosomal protein L28 [Nitrospinota bacterium]